MQTGTWSAFNHTGHEQRFNGVSNSQWFNLDGILLWILHTYFSLLYTLMFCVLISTVQHLVSMDSAGPTTTQNAGFKCQYVLSSNIVLMGGLFLRLLLDLRNESLFNILRCAPSAALLRRRALPLIYDFGHSEGQSVPRALRWKRLATLVCCTIWWIWKRGAMHGTVWRYGTYEPFRFQQPLLCDLCNVTSPTMLL